jgi:hypothetical protein
MGKGSIGFLSADDILAQFGKEAGAARKQYESFVKGRVGKYRGGELSSGGLRRSAGFVVPMAFRREEDMQLYDERILGDGDFVESVLRRREGESREKKVSLDEVMRVVREKTGVGEKEVRSRSQVRQVVKARALYCYLAREKSGVNGAVLMKQLGMTSGGISSLVSRGRGYHETGNL